MGYSHVIVQPAMCTTQFLAQFRNYLSMVPQYHYLQDPEWFVCNAGPGIELVVTYLGEDIVASSVVRRVGYRFSPKAKFIVRNGPIFRDFASLAAHLQSLIQRLTGSVLDIRISPPSGEGVSAKVGLLMKELGFRRYHDYSGNYTSTVTIDLVDRGEDVTAGFSPALKRQLRKAASLETHVDRLHDEGDLCELLGLLRDFYRERGLGMPGQDVLACYLKRRILLDGDGVALVLRKERRMIAGIIVIGCGDRAIFSYSFRAKNDQLDRLPLTHLLHYRAICWAQEHGYRVYDFGGYSEGQSGDGINRFKLGFSGRIEMVSENYLYTFNPVYTLLSGFLDRIRNYLLVRSG